MWSFWLAAGIAFIGGLWPLVFGGTSSRVAMAVIPFTVSAAALAACGFFYRQGRAITAVIYFVGGLALVYGLLSMLAVPLEIAVLGSCPAPPAPCAQARCVLRNPTTATRRRTDRSQAGRGR